MSEKGGSPEGASTASGTTSVDLSSVTSAQNPSSLNTHHIVSQADMCQHFIPILLEKGSIVHKMGKRMARPARKGEVVKTMIDGVVVAETVALDETSMVIRQESADHELYKLDAVKFAQNFNTTGMEIVETEPRFEELRNRGFRYYERKGQALIYQVTEKDMEFVPSGLFENAFSTTPTPLRIGDYLVTGYPEPLEVYMTRHNTIYRDGQVCHGPNVVSQEKMREYFLEKMRRDGGWFRRAGMRLARQARKGEEVCTIINGELVSKMIVPDDSSMIIQEESADREIYCLSMKSFKESYEPEGKEITEQGSEWDACRERGFKYYAKTGGMVLMYQITAEDMELVPSGYFQVPFSLVPFPLRVGDSLVTRADIADPIIYASRNAEQVYYSQKNLVVHYVFSSPLGHASLSFAKELDGLRTSGAIVRLTCATSENLRLLKKVWGGLTLSVLHVACHVCATTTSELAVLLEDQAGQQHPVTAASFADLVIGKHVPPQVVVLTCCNSKAVADVFLERGVERVVAVRENLALLDRAAHDFTLSFYGELRAHRSVESSFDFAVRALRTSPDQALVAEADKFMLLPLDRKGSFHLGDKRMTRTYSSMGSESLEPHIAVRVPFGVGEAGCIGPLIQPESPMVFAGHIPPSRSHFIVNCLSVLTKFRVLKIHAPPGSGKKTIAGMLAKFAAFPGGRAFSGGAVMVYPLSYSGIPSQDEMRNHFLPVLNKKGTLVQKVGRLLCRPAKKGEEVQTVIDGEVVARIVVDSDDCMVVRHESADHELYVHKPAVFNKNYITPGTDITEEGPEFDVLRERGFKYYERRGMVLLYKVTEEDMQFFPEGKFQASFSETPIPIKVGDHLATSFPNPEGKLGEVYLSRNAEQVYLSKVVRTNREMYQHFAPIMAKEGTIARRVGKWLARPAIPGEVIQTIVGMQVISRTTVSDNRSMVVLADSAEGEQYVLNERQFAKGYKLPGEELTKQGLEWDRLRSQGFRSYERLGTVRILQATEAHLEFVPAGKFWGNCSSTPQDLKIGDYLVTGYPDGRDVYVSRNAEQVFAPIPLSEVVRSQDDMRGHFLPLLIEKGIKMQRHGRVAARPATKGETIRTIIDGEMVAKSIAQDDSSMVVRAETSDREMYVLDKKSFCKKHSIGVEITEDGAEFDALRRRGFKWYTCKGLVYLHEVTLEDIEFVPGGSFVVSFSVCPQPLQIGDYLAVDYPDGKDVYLSRNALQLYTQADEDDGSILSPVTPFTPKSHLSRQFSRQQSPQLQVGSPALWLNLQGRRNSGVDSPDASSISGSAICSSTWTRDTGMASKSILEDALLAVASKQAALAGRWYEGHKPAQEVSAESAMASWLKTVPSGSRALLVLVGGERFLAHDAPRELLRRLLRNHPCLHLLVTLADKQAAGPALDPLVGEHPWPVELPPLQPRDAADLFCRALMRHQQGRHLIAKMTLEQAVSKLEQLPVVLSCEGRPRDILETVQRVAETATSLDDL